MQIKPIMYSTLLQDEFVSRELKSFDLNFKQFVAGELEIISLPEISESERNGRLAFLKLYHTMLLQQMTTSKSYSGMQRGYVALN